MFDIHNRAGLAIARGLAPFKQYRVLGATYSIRPFSNSMRRWLRSNSTADVYFLNTGWDHPAMTDELADLVRRLNVDVLIPAGHHTTLAISRAKPSLSQFCHVMVEEPEKTRLLHDKIRTMEMSAELGIPYPQTIIPQSTTHLESVVLRIPYPAVIKACKSVGAQDVWYARSASELLDLYHTITTAPDTGDGFFTDRSTLMVQEFIPGELHDVTAYCVDGRLVAGLTQKRLVTVPSNGGAGYVVVTTRQDQLLEQARKLIRHTRWNGVFLMDFKIDERDGVAKLLEVNPRFWGTTWLTISAGLNYPHYFIQHALGERVSCPRAYQVGLVARWPLMELKGILERPVTCRLLARRLLGFTARSLTKGCVTDIMLSDIRPTVLHCIEWAEKAARKGAASLGFCHRNWGSKEPGASTNTPRGASSKNPGLSEHSFKGPSEDE